MTDLTRDKNALLTEVESLESKLTHSTSAEKTQLERFSELENKLREATQALTAKQEDGESLLVRLCMYVSARTSPLVRLRSYVSARTVIVVLIKVHCVVTGACCVC